MLKTYKYFFILCNKYFSPQSSSCTIAALNGKNCIFMKNLNLSEVKWFNTSEPRKISPRGYNKKAEKKLRASKDEGTSGELSESVSGKREFDFLPDANLPNKLFEGIPFKELPIVNIKSTPNNTIMNLTDYKGVTKLLRSCGIEGFKNVKKGTNIAAQATAITFSTLAIEKGYKTVRVRIQGIGPGRMSSIKGLSMGGLNIISITDNTPVSDNPPRPKKQRRI